MTGAEATGFGEEATDGGAGTAVTFGSTGAEEDEGMATGIAGVSAASGESLEVLGVLEELDDLPGACTSVGSVGGDGFGVFDDFDAPTTGVAGGPNGVGPAAPTVSTEVGVDESTSGVSVTIVPSRDLDDEGC